MKRLIAIILLLSILMLTGCGSQNINVNKDSTSDNTISTSQEAAAMKDDIINGSYGSHERNTFDLYFASPKDSLPTPLVIYIHGGGFSNGDKSEFSQEDKEKCLENGISYATINYPFIQHKPLQDILKDIARAVQYFKYHADEFNINKEKISCYGCSAGAGSSLFLAAKSDMADKNNSDPVLRESTRIFSAGIYDTQSTYDFYQWPELLNLPIDQLLVIQQQMFGSPLSVIYGEPINTAEDFLKPNIVEIRKFLDMTSDLSNDDCPIYIKTSYEKSNKDEILHAQVFSQSVYQKCLDHNIKAELYTPEENSKNSDFISFLLELL